MSTIGTSHPTVQVYDSMLSTASSDVKKQVAGLFHTTHPHITLEFINVHKQAGGSDFGLFAIAYVTALTHGISPSKCHFDQQKMRPHLIKCLQQRKMEMFPVMRERRPQPAIKSQESFPVLHVQNAQIFKGPID